MTSPLTIRIARLTDAPQLREIYRPYVERTAITFEYTVPTVAEFRDRMATTLKRYPYLVAEQAGQIVGYAYVGTFGSRAGYDWAVETSIYVAPASRHTGVGKRLYAALEDICRLMGITNLNACIAYPADADPHLTKNSAEFHHHLGYQLAGHFHRCGCKFGRWYDIIWMEKAISDHPHDPQPVISFNDLRGSIRDRLGIV
jgi:L-amino acid N-acyltransferase YncA